MFLLINKKIWFFPKKLLLAHERLPSIISWKRPKTKNKMMKNNPKDDRSDLLYLRVGIDEKT